MASLSRLSAVPVRQTTQADHTVRDTYGRLPIHTAIISDRVDFLRRYLQQGASATSQVVDQRRRITLSPLMYALSLGSIACLKELLENSASKRVVSLKEKVEGIGNVLHVAAAYRQIKAAAFLLDANHLKETRSLLKARNEKGRTPLMEAAIQGDSDMIALLVKKNLKTLSCKDSSGKTALHLAAANGHEQACDMLLALGARVDAEDANLERPFQSALNPDLKERLKKAYQTLKNKENSPPNFYEDPPENLCYKGGGAKGGVHLGVSEFFAQAPEDYARVTQAAPIRMTGTSAGAIKATLDALNFTSLETREIMENGSFKEFKDYMFGNITFKGGAFDGVKFLKWMKEQVKKKAITEDFPQGKENFTFGDLRRAIKAGAPYKHLYIYATKASPTKEIVCFNSEDKEWDNLPIAEAVRASISIPVAFVPYTLQFIDPNSGRLILDSSGSVYHDGGILMNLPTKTFDRRRFTRLGEPNPNQPEFNKRTLAFNICPSDAASEAKHRRNYSLRAMFVDLCEIYSDAEKLYHKDQEFDDYRTVDISNCGIKALNFNLNSSQKQELVDSGREATHAFFAKEKLLALLNDAESADPHEKALKRMLASRHYEKEKNYIQAYLKTPNFLRQLLGYPNRRAYMEFFTEKLYDEAADESIERIDFSKAHFPKAFISEILMSSHKCLTVFLENKIISPQMLLSRLLDLLDCGKFNEAKAFSKEYQKYFQDLFRSDERGFEEAFSTEAMDKLYSCNKFGFVEFFIENGLMARHRALLVYRARGNIEEVKKIYQKYAELRAAPKRPVFDPFDAVNFQPNLWLSELGLPKKLEPEECWRVLLHHINRDQDRAAITLFEKYHEIFRSQYMSKQEILTEKQQDFFYAREVIPRFASTSNSNLGRK